MVSSEQRDLTQATSGCWKLFVTLLVAIEVFEADLRFAELVARASNVCKIENKHHQQLRPIYIFCLKTFETGAVIAKSRRD